MSSHNVGKIITCVKVRSLKEKMKSKMEHFPATNPNPVLSVEKDGTIVYSNKAGEPLLREWCVAVGDKLPSNIGEVVQKVISHNSPEKMEIVAGSRVYSISLHHLPEEGCVNIYGFDISDRKEFEEKLRESEEKYRNIVETANEGIWIVDAESETIYVNKKMTDMLGYSQGEMIGRFVVDFIDKEYKVYTKLLMEKRQQGIDEVHENKFIRKDGSFLWALVNSKALFNNSGKFTGVLAMLSDISERKRSEETILAKEAELLLIADATPVLLNRLSRDLKYVFVNHATTELFGRTREEIVGKPIVEIMGKDAFESIRPYVEKVLQGQRVEYEREIPYQGVGGRFMHVVYIPERNEKGEVVGWLASISDITERKRAEKALHESEERFRTMANAIPQLAWIARADGYIFWYNERWYAYTGTTPEQMEGWGWQSVHDPAVLPKVLEQWRASIATGKSFDMEFPLRGADGIFRPFLTRVLPLKNAKGQVLQWFGTNTDISLRKQEEYRIFRYNRIQEGINRIFSEVVQAKTEEELGNTILSVALDVTGGGIGFVNLIGDDGLMHDIAISEGGWNQCVMYDKAGHRRPTGNFVVHGLYGHVVTSGKGFFSNDPQLHPESIGLPLGHPELTSFLGVPLIQEGKAIGMLGVANREGVYSREQLEDLEAIAPAVTQALKRKREEQERKQIQLLMESDLKALTITHTLSRKLLGEDGIQPLLQEIMDAAVAIVDAKMGTLQLLEGDSLRIVASCGHQQSFLNYFGSAENVASVCGEATQRGERVIVVDVEKSPLFAGTPSLEIMREAGVRSVQSTPIISRNGKLLGILTTQWDIPYSPNEHDLWRIDLLTRQAADMIEQARSKESLRCAYEDLKAQSEELQVQNEELQAQSVELQVANESLAESETRFRTMAENLDKLVKERTAELEKAYVSLKENERSLAEAQDMAHVGSWERNIAINKLYWSDEMYRIFGLKPQEFEMTYDLLLNHYVHPDDRDYLDKAVKGAFNGKPYSINYRIILRNGEERIVNAKGEVIFDDQNNPVRIRGTTQDITERKHAEEALAKIEIARKQEIHHRIKNNLQVINSLLDLQAETFRDQECIKDSEVLRAFRESQNRVISMALIHEELYKGGGFETLNFSPYIQELSENLLQTYAVGNNNISLKLDLTENAFFDMDTAVPLGIIVNELVSNSLKHAFKGRNRGEIQIKLHREENGECIKSINEDCSAAYVLSVSDNGVGIPENIDIEDLESLGLQLVTSLVDQLDGQLELKRNNGTEFTIKLSVIEKDNQASEAAQQFIE